MSSVENSIHMIVDPPNRKDTNKFTEHILKRIVCRGESINNLHKRLSM